MAEDDMDGISPDSSFYGDDDLKKELTEESLSLYRPTEYWHTIHPKLPSVIALKKGLPPAFQKQTQPHDTGKSKIYYNPFETRARCARQLDETVNDFLERLPPQTSKVDDVGPWIWIADPRSDSRVTDEDVAGLKKEGQRLLDDFHREKEMVEQETEPGRGKTRSKATVARRVKPLRDQLYQSLLTLGRRHGIKTGKWMLFPSATQVDTLWHSIAIAVADGYLGPCAKVATDNSGSADSSGNSTRLICVYTRDFEDKTDVTRVLQKLLDIGVLDGDGRGLKDRPGGKETVKGIYYKADVFTHLDIMGGNKWGLKASLYSSLEVLESKKGK